MNFLVHDATILHLKLQSCLLWDTEATYGHIHHSAPKKEVKRHMFNQAFKVVAISPKFIFNVIWT